MTYVWRFSCLYKTSHDWILREAPWSAAAAATAFRHDFRKRVCRKLRGPTYGLRRRIDSADINSLPTKYHLDFGVHFRLLRSQFYLGRKHSL